MKGALTPPGTSAPSTPRAEDRLDSWKEIAEYLRRGVRTVRRWEKEEGLPVHRHLHHRQGAVYAYKSELDVWWDARPVRLEEEPMAHSAAQPEETEPAQPRAAWRSMKIALAMGVALAAALATYGIWRRDATLTPGSANRAMLAVLPFENLTGDTEQEFFSDGLTEELITELGRLHPDRLGVIARTSAMQYKGANKRADEIARELGVDYLVEGSVRREGQRIRVTAQLIRASDQTHVWARNYERASQGVLSVQSDVARAVAAEIQLQLPDPRAARVAAIGRVGVEAHEAYLKGRYFLERRTPDGILHAREWFERAIALEPDYASAFVGLADSHILAVTYANAEPRQAMEHARRAVHKALALDERLPEAHAWLGIILTEYDWNWSGAEKAFRRAIELDPNFAYAHKLNAEYLSYVGKFDQAVAEARLAQRLDPLSVVTNSMLGIVLYRARRYDEALAPIADAVRLNPDHPLPYLPLGLAYAQLGRYEEAIAALERAKALAADNSEMVAQVGYVHARAGNVRAAHQVLADLGERAAAGYVAPFHFAIVHSGLGETDQALEWLEQGFQQRLWLLCVIKSDPIFDPLRSNPRFQALLRRMKFSDTG